MIDKEKVEAGVWLILEGIGEDVNREGLLDTPDRIARMYEEIFGGMDMDAAEPLKQAGKNRGNLCKTASDSGAAYGTGGRCTDGTVKTEGGYGHDGSRAYVHDHARNQETGQ